MQVLVTCKRPKHYTTTQWRECTPPLPPRVIPPIPLCGTDLRHLPPWRWVAFCVGSIRPLTVQPRLVTRCMLHGMSCCKLHARVAFTLDRLAGSVRNCGACAVPSPAAPRGAGMLHTAMPHAMSYLARYTSCHIVLDKSCVASAPTRHVAGCAPCFVSHVACPPRVMVSATVCPAPWCQLLRRRQHHDAVAPRSAVPASRRRRRSSRRQRRA